MSLQTWKSGRELVGILSQSPINRELEMFGIHYKRLNRDAFTVIGEGGSTTTFELAELLVSFQPID